MTPTKGPHRFNGERKEYILDARGKASYALTFLVTPVLLRPPKKDHGVYSRGKFRRHGRGWLEEPVYEKRRNFDFSWCWVNSFLSPLANTGARRSGSNGFGRGGGPSKATRRSTPRGRVFLDSLDARRDRSV